MLIWKIMVVVLLFTMLPARDGQKLLNFWYHMVQTLIWRTRLVTSHNCDVFYISNFDFNPFLFFFFGKKKGKRLTTWTAFTWGLFLNRQLNDISCEIHIQVGCTPLHRAASTGKSELCELLIEEGAEVDAVDKAGQTPLMNAVICYNKEVNCLKFN